MFSIEPPVLPMLSKPSREIPVGAGWLYEPKWDGFRAIVFRDGDRVHIGSRNARPLGRYFPEVVATIAEALPERVVCDGEIVIAGDNGLDFDALQLRLHPADSRVRMLAEKIPASFVAFDLLALGDRDLRDSPLSTRREELAKVFEAGPMALLTPQTSDVDEARDWFVRFEGAGLDGIVAKRADSPYRSGERTMVKVKHLRTADCVVGGYRLSKDKKGVGSLLLGLYVDGHLHYAGHTSSFTAKQKAELLPMLQKIAGDSGFGEGRSPGGQSRWSTGEEQEWVSVRPVLVCEVAFDHLQGPRFRHGTTFLRWRADKDPQECTLDQLEPPHPFDLNEIRRMT